MSRRTLITNGMYVYYIDMILPHLRLAGTYEKACKDYEFWEIDQRVSNYYYDIVKILAMFLLPLSLLVFGIFANHVQEAMPFDDLALGTALLNGWRDFHDLLLISLTSLAKVYARGINSKNDCLDP